MIKMRMTDKQNLCVAILEAEISNVVPDHWDVGLKGTVDQNISLGRHDQVCGQILAANVIEVPGDVKRWKRRRPVGVLLRGCTPCGEN
jgi:hypothetical protein